MPPNRPRRRLPARVYWFRRLLVLSLAFALVFGIGKLLGGGAGDSERAVPASAPGSATTSPTAAATADARPATTKKAKARKKKKVKKPLPTPTGPCEDSDVRVVPTFVETPRAGGDVRLTLQLSTFKTPACTWEVGPDTVAVKLTSGSDRIWSSQDCGSAVPETPVVLRRRTTTTVDVMWPGRRSDLGCSVMNEWAEPGYYHVEVAALGSEPESRQFELHYPATRTITPTPTPRPEKKADRRSDETAEKKKRKRDRDG